MVKVLGKKLVYFDKILRLIREIKVFKSNWWKIVVCYLFMGKLGSWLECYFYYIYKGYIGGWVSICVWVWMIISVLRLVVRFVCFSFL